MKQFKYFNRLAKKKILSIGILVATISFLGACGNYNSTNQAIINQPLEIVTTTTMLDDLVSIIGGELVTVTGLMGPGVDPHLYKASAGDVDKLDAADVIIYNGLHLEGTMTEVFDAMESRGKTIISLEDGLDENTLLLVEENTYDPHVWFDVSLWMAGCEYITESLIEIDVANESYYQNNCDNYLKELETLEFYIIDRLNELDESSKKLVTAHDAFGYFGNAYGVEVYALQGISTDTEASTKDVSELADFITEYKIKSIFVESSVSSKNLEALQDAVIARGFAVAIGGELYSDSLGDESSGHNSYIRTVMANVDTIVDSLK